GSMHALIGERQRQELVERILGLVAQPRESRAPATARAQYLGKKLIGRREIGARQQCAEELRRSGKKRMLANAPAQFAPERALARVGKLKQLVVVEAAERAFQHGCERQIVFGQQQEAAE